jgi:hypothetical protein
MWSSVLKYIIPKFFSIILLNILTQVFAAEVDAIAAIVGDKVITNLDVAHLKSFMLVQGRLSSDNLSDPGINDAMLNLGVERRLMLNYAAGPTTEMPKDDKLLGYFLKHQNLDSAKFQASLDANDLSKENFVSFLEEDFLIQQHQNSYLAGRISISDSRAKNYISDYNQNNTKYHVVDFHVQKSGGGLTAASFSDMISSAVKNYSAGSEVISPVMANDLGVRVLGDFPELYKNVILNLKESVASYMVIADNGYHALLLQNKQVPAELSVQDAKQILYSQEAGDSISSWLRDLKKSEYIKIT